MKIIRDNEVRIVRDSDNYYNVIGIRDAVFNQLKALAPDEVTIDDQGNFSIIIDILPFEEWEEIMPISEELTTQLNIKSYLPGELVFAKDPHFNNEILYYLFQGKHYPNWIRKNRGE